MPGIIFEGPDGAGKTTTAQYISRAVGIPIYHAGGPPNTQAEMDERVNRMLSMDNTIFDRFPLISEQIYGPIVRGKCLIDLTDWKMKIPFPVVYCRPSIETIFKTTILEKPHKSRIHVKEVKENLDAIINEYDELMSEIPHIKFNRDIHHIPQLVNIVIRKL